MKKGLIAAALLGVATLPAIALSAQPACDRTCLEGFVDKYLDAMQAHKASDTLFTKDAKFTEDGIRLPLGGEGLWYGMSGRGTYRFFVPDCRGPAGRVHRHAQGRPAPQWPGQPGCHRTAPEDREQQDHRSRADRAAARQHQLGGRWRTASGQRCRWCTCCWCTTCSRCACTPGRSRKHREAGQAA